MTTHEAIFNSPEKCRLRQRIQYLESNYKRKIRNLQQNVRRKNVKIATLKDVLNELKRKKMLNDEQISILETLGESTGDLFKRIARKKNCYVACMIRIYVLLL